MSALSIEQYHKYNAAQRKRVKKEDLQKMLDEHLATDGGNVNSLRGILREELATKLEELKTELSQTIENKLQSLREDNERLTAENESMKGVLKEHQKFFERQRKEETKNNIFISGIPKTILSDMSDIPGPNTAAGETSQDHKEIIHHILEFVNPDLKKEDYKILINFETKPGFSRHSAKIRTKDTETKTKIFKGCRKFKDLGRNSYLKKIFLKNDDPPLTRKENDRLQEKVKELRNLEDANNPVNRYRINKGKLLKNDTEIVDFFNLNNQIFQ